MPPHRRACMQASMTIGAAGHTLHIPAQGPRWQHPQDPAPHLSPCLTHSSASAASATSRAASCCCRCSRLMDSLQGGRGRGEEVGSRRWCPHGAGSSYTSQRSLLHLGSHRCTGPHPSHPCCMHCHVTKRFPTPTAHAQSRYLGSAA